MKHERDNGDCAPAAGGNAHGAVRDEASPPAGKSSSAVATASPRARRAAAQLGIDWTRLKASGTSGRIAERDVLAAANNMPEAARVRRVPHSATRRTIAARMVESHQTTAPVTLTTKVDATNLVGLREQFRAAAAELETPSSDINEEARSCPATPI